MSKVYARSGGWLFRSGPSGSARAAISAATSTKTSGSTRKLVSAELLSAMPKKISWSDFT